MAEGDSGRRPLISVIGQGDVAGDDPRYDLAVNLGRALVDNGFRIITGGYGGIMEGASLGARQSENYREGDIIGILKGFDPTSANRYVDVSICTGFNFARNQIIASSDGVVAVGGGAGTLSEIAMAWQLGRLIIALRVDGWSGEVADRPLDGRKRYSDIPDDRIYGADDEHGVVEILSRHLARYMHEY
ncbi:MAG: TIGR00725 family protein [Thermoplasmatota archaeon]